MTTKYLHTINGRPAYYDKKEGQICYRTFYGKAFLMADSLEQIRAEQKASSEWRERQGFDNHDNKYGYVRIAV